MTVWASGWLAGVEPWKWKELVASGGDDGQAVRRPPGEPPTHDGGYRRWHKAAAAARVVTCAKGKPEPADPGSALRSTPPLFAFAFESEAQS